ncbi:phage holin family protein [Peptostreptococcaceae bacterium OttesenSCG-928-C18]|nr:phage holin family protein [Peptostreptococcaceae bacterium OttesenSCG-928-C18]
MINSKILLQSITDLIYSPYMHILVWAIFIDILTGTAKAFLLKKGDSSVGLKGLIKHSLVILLLFFVNVYFPIFNYGYVAKGFNSFFIVQYLVSIAENWGELGLPMPKQVRKSLIRISDEMDKSFVDLLKDRKQNKEGDK